MQFKDLSQKHPTYDAGLWTRLGDVYTGGYELLENAKQYLPQAINEPAQRYEDRIKSASYVPHFGQVIDFLTAALHEQPVRVASAEEVDGVYDLLAHDADLKGSPFSRLIRDASRDALINGRALIAADFPQLDVEPASLAEEEAVGAGRPYVYPVPLSSLLDWEYGPRGDFLWAVLHQKRHLRGTPFAREAKCQDEFRVWQLGADGLAHWSLYRTEPRALSKDANPNEELTLADEGRTTFRRIPLVELSLPAGLWAGNKLGPLAEELFRRRSMLHGAMARNLIAIPIAFLGSEIGPVHGELPGEAQQNPARGNDPVARAEQYGFMALGKDDRFEWSSPDATAYQLTAEQLRETRDEMFRVVHAMALSMGTSAAAIGRSADSKREDRRAVGVVLDALGAYVREFAETIYETISEARGEDIAWSGSGLDRYDLEEADQLVLDAQAAREVGLDSSPTFQRLLKQRTARRLLPDVSPEEAAAIETEISGVVPVPTEGASQAQ